SSGVWDLSGMVAPSVCSLRGDRLLGPFVNVQLKDVRASVVADDVEVEFPADDLRAINLRRQDHLVFSVGTGEKVPERIGDATLKTKNQKRKRLNSHHP